METLPQTLQLAYIYDASALQSACLAYTREHLSTIMMTVGFKRLIQPHKELMVTPSTASHLQSPS